jgi:hypothetical protein
MAKSVYTLEVTLLDDHMTGDFVRGDPSLSRTIEIRSGQTLSQLHEAIVEAYGRWAGCHRSEFHFGRRPQDRPPDQHVLPTIRDDLQDSDELVAFRDPTRTRLSALRLHTDGVFWYWYYFGGHWYHEIRLLAIGEPQPGVEYPRIVAPLPPTVGRNGPRVREDSGDETWHLSTV